MKIPVIYIAGWGRSGSTLLGNLLGSIEGMQHVGELTYIWEHGWKYNHLCGCGARFQECIYWKRIVSDAFGGFSGIDIDKMIWIRNKHISNKKVFWSLIWKKSGWENELIAYYLYNLSRLYKSIFKIGKKSIIVDSSKMPFQCYLLSLEKEIDLYIVHLIRDSRGCAYSWNKEIDRRDVDGRQSIKLERFDFIGSTLRWNFWNAIIDLLGNGTKCIVVRYEDFATDPLRVLGEIGKLVGVDIPWKDTSEIVIKTNHTVWGNPSRMRTGKVKIRLDDAWRREMPLKDRLLVTALSWPWLLKYGYLGKTT